MEDIYENVEFQEKKIIYPAYQTTNRYRNLYSDVRTWVRELIQNADDADAKSIKFVVDIPKQIYVENDGKVFDDEDINRLLTPCLGGKEFEKTGAMNLGALSVLSISDKPWYHSGRTILKFVMDHKNEDFVPYINENYKDYQKGTRVFLPLHNRLSKEDIKKLYNIDGFLNKHPHLLFTLNLKKIELIYDRREFIIEKQVVSEEIVKNRHMKVKVHELLISQNQKIKNSTTVKESKWKIFTTYVKVPKKYFSEKELALFDKDIKIPLNIAFKIKNHEHIFERVNYPVYIVFPSDTSLGLGFVVSSNFKPETSRKGISTEGRDGDYNIFLLKKFSELLEISLNFFKNKISQTPLDERRRIFDSLLNVLYYKETYTSIENYIQKHIKDQCYKYLENNLLDLNGKWRKIAKIAIAEKEMQNFFENDFNFINTPSNPEIKQLLKDIGIKEIMLDDLISKLISGNIEDKDQFLSIWKYLSKYRKDLMHDHITLILDNKTIVNRYENLVSLRNLAITHKDAIGLFDPNKEAHPMFLKDDQVRNLLKSLKVLEVKPKQILNYFISIKKPLSIKNFDLIKSYYAYFHKYALLDKKRELVLTNHGFKNPEDSFFKTEEITEVIDKYLSFVPQQLESDKICNLFLKNLGVSRELSIKIVVKLIKRYKSRVISLKLLRFLSDNSQKLSNEDISQLKQLEIIPTTNDKYVKPSDCYLLDPEIVEIFGDLVNYFDPKEEENKDWLKFYKKLGVSKRPQIEHLKLALTDVVNEFKSSNERGLHEKLLKRFELIFESIYNSKEPSEKSKLISEISKLNCIPTKFGLVKPINVYIKSKKVETLVGDSVPYCLINIPNAIMKNLGMSEEPSPKDVFIYLISFLTNQKKNESIRSNRKVFLKTLDKVYSYLGNSENFMVLSRSEVNELVNSKIIYLPDKDKFKRVNSIVAYSKEAEMIYGDHRDMLKLSVYPNSFNFFKKVGVKTSININDLADFLVEYCSRVSINTDKLFMLYNNIGLRFRFLSNKQKTLLKRAFVILTEDMKTFKTSNDIFIPDNKLFAEKFPSLNIAAINDRNLLFLEQLGVRKISDVIEKTVRFNGNIEENDLTKNLKNTVLALIPYIATIIKNSDLPVDTIWKKRLKAVKFLICDEIYYRLKYKAQSAHIIGKSVEFSSKDEIIALSRKGYDENSAKFTENLAGAITHLIFLKNTAQVKLVSPLIEKLLKSNDKLQTLKDLGFSTLKLEAKNLKVPKLKIELPRIDKHNEVIKTNLSFERSTISHQTGASHLDLREFTSMSWQPRKYNIAKRQYTPDKNFDKSRRNLSQKSIDPNEINIILKEPPSQEQVVKFVKNHLNSTINSRSVSDQLKLTKFTQRSLKNVRKTLFKRMEFPGRAEYGGLDITPPIPMLELKKHNHFHYYLQEGLDVSIKISILENFSKVLKKIVEIMEGNPETVIVGIFKAPVNAFNYEGQLIFNYPLMIDYTLQVPPYLFWIFIAAHELAHNIGRDHGQLHSKYMMLFAIKAIDNLSLIREFYLEHFK